MLLEHAADLHVFEPAAKHKGGLAVLRPIMHISIWILMATMAMLYAAAGMCVC